MSLPPGQRAVRGLPRFGVDTGRPPPAWPEGARIEVTGPLTRSVSLAPEELAGLRRRRVTAGLHCVAGWSALDLAWEGVPFADVYRDLVEPALEPGARVRYVVVVGLDGYRSILRLEDALAGNVLLADVLDGTPLTPDHGAPVRLVSPDQYGFVSTKHVCRVELYPYEPAAQYHPNRRVQRALLLVRPHARARVSREERHRFLPGRVAREIYRRVIDLPAPPL